MILIPNFLSMRLEKVGGKTIRNVRTGGVEKTKVKRRLKVSLSRQLAKQISKEIERKIESNGHDNDSK